MASSTCAVREAKYRGWRGVFLKRLDFDPLFEPLVGFVVLALAQINAAEIVEGTAIERIDFDLLLKGVLARPSCPSSKYAIREDPRRDCSWQSASMARLSNSMARSSVRSGGPRCRCG